MSLRHFAKSLGRRGGLERARRLSAAKKKEIASAGARARLESLEIARRIRENFLYLEAIQEMVPPPNVRREENVRHKLPDIYG